MISRRQLLQLALLSPLAAALAKAQSLRNSLSSAPTAVVSDDDVSQVKIERRWKANVCQSHVVNHGSQPVRIKEVVIFDLNLSLPATTRLYGEGFQMLSQTGGTLGQPLDLGNYTDAKHYKLPNAFYGMMTLSPSNHEHHLFAFTSCHRFIGQFYLNHPSLKVVVDTEGRELKPGETWELEPFIYLTGNGRE